MKHQGGGVIRLNDKTDHGGQVISATSGTTMMGVAAALQDDMTVCPKCKGNFAIKPDGAGENTKVSRILMTATQRHAAHG